MKKNVFLMAGILLLSLLLLPGLVGCTPSTQGKVIYIRTYGTVISASFGFTFEDAADGVIDNPIFTGGVTVETENGERIDARWDRTTPPDGGERVIVWTGGSRLDWRVERELAGDEDLTLINIVSVETDDNKILDVLWDEEALGTPIVQSMGMTVEIKPTDNPDIWRVTRIITTP